MGAMGMLGEGGIDTPRREGLEASSANISS